MNGRAECPAGCGRTVAPGQLMCGPCWGEVPFRLKRLVNRTWEAYRRLTLRDQGPGARETRRAYREARDAAIGAIR